MSRYEWATDCVSCPDHLVPALHEMVAQGEQVTFKHFRRLVGADQVRRWADGHGYDRRPPGLTLSRDWGVRFYTSTFNGQRCAYIEWSAIEHIWVRKESA